MFFKNRRIMEINFDHLTPFLLEFLSYLNIILWQYRSNFPKNKFRYVNIPKKLIIYDLSYFVQNILLFSLHSQPLISFFISNQN